MSISGNILVDKLRISIPVSVLSMLGIKLNDYKVEISNVFEKHYPKTACSVGSSRGYLRITLTPTRFKPPHDNYFTDINIEMPTELWLLNLFDKLGFDNRRLSESATITWIHLTKNLIVDNAVAEYINFLNTYPFKNGYKSGLIYSSSRGRTLRIATQKRDKTKDDINGNRNIVFYDKVLDFVDKANKDFIYPKEPLTKEEIKVLRKHDVFYSEKYNRLSLLNLNMLRCELQYRYKDKISVLAKALNGNNEDSLTVAEIVDLLQQKQLYSKLDEFYKNQLKEVIFYNPPKTIQDTNCNNFQKMFSDLITQNDISKLKIIYKACNLDKKFDGNLKKVFAHTINELYMELYNKLELG